MDAIAVRGLDFSYGTTRILKNVKEHAAKAPVGRTSGWRRAGQRVLLARALVSEPRLLLLDEPTSGMYEAGHRGGSAFVSADVQGAVLRVLG